MTSDNIEVVAALGRPFTLGMLYDARRDEIIPGIMPWDEETVQKYTKECDHHGSEFKVFTSDSMEEKSFLLDVGASLKLSFYGGLIEVGGSAKYLNDKRKSHNQSRVTFQYKATTSFKKLSKILDVARNTDQINHVKGLATHVVTGILYGANAFFVFDSEKLDTSSIQDVQGNMEAVIKKIPSFSIEGEANVKLTDEEKALIDKFSCKFYGDFILDSNPTTFVDAVKTYQQLPKLLGKSGERSVPLKVWMLPLKTVAPDAAKVMSVISIGLVRKAGDVLEDVKELEIRCNDCLEDAVVNSFPQIQKKVKRFQNLCKDYAAAVQEEIAKKLPSIRAGDEDESSLRKVFKDRKRSPFSQENLSSWMDSVEREINIISSCVQMMEGVKIVPNQSELDKKILDPGVEEVFSFVFTSLETADPFHQKLADYVDHLEPQSPGGVKIPKQDQWCFSDEVTTKMREKAKVFSEFVKGQKSNSRICFLVAAITNEKHKGGSIYHYNDSSLVTDDFSKPEVPDVMNITDRRDLMCYACDLTLDPNSAQNNLILSEGNKKATHGVSQSYPDHPDRFDVFHQVMCKEELTGRHYWEVEWSSGESEDVAVGVSYRGMWRKGYGDGCRLGYNVMSWCLGHRWNPPNPTLYAEHDKKATYQPVPSSGFCQVGVYLDWPAGTLSYYKVSANTLTHLHTFSTTFTEPVCPCFMIWCDKNYVFLPL
ncbi:neoverrucotoxin subunit alpha-like [Mastacembelus armatus]|uniref:Neoverrucotoxin subunit alpha-like n=1 Tax=Mastacembelus armatus TaxID=205130 RepID=A0A3Q3M051_9TELE|nr:neoverrucotoxin subunit alpha-like [Mastacembelus armatus]